MLPVTRVDLRIIIAARSSSLSQFDKKLEAHKTTLSKSKSIFDSVPYAVLPIPRTNDFNIFEAWGALLKQKLESRLMEYLKLDQIISY